MPTAALRACVVPGCPDPVVARGRSRCAAHEVQAERARRAHTPGRLVPGQRGHLIDYYQTPQWRALRDRVLREEPLCMYCQREGRTRASTTVDHIIPRPEGPDTRENLRGCCASCHAQKTRAENR